MPNLPSYDKVKGNSQEQTGVISFRYCNSTWSQHLGVKTMAVTEIGRKWDIIDVGSRCGDQYCIHSRASYQHFDKKGDIGRLYDVGVKSRPGVISYRYCINTWASNNFPPLSTMSTMAINLFNRQIYFKIPILAPFLNCNHNLSENIQFVVFFLNFQKIS